MKIITVCLNPCLDVNYKLDYNFKAGGLNRMNRPSEKICGKSVNVSRAFKKLSKESLILGIFPDDGSLELLRKEGLNVSAVKTGGKLRRNISIISANGEETQINEPGNEIGDDVLKEFTGLFKCELNCGDETVVIISGSLPPGVNSGYYKKLCKIAKNFGAYVVLDCDGEALKQGVEALPDLIKPNRDEFSALTGENLSEHGEGVRIDAVKAALEFSRNNNCMSVICTLDCDGSVYAGEGGSFMCSAVKTNVNNFKGAGDAFLASFIYEKLMCEADTEMALIKSSAFASDWISK